MPANAAITTFPFYSRESEPTHRRHWCGETPFAQPVTTNKLPPWLIKAPGTGTTQVWCHNLDRNRWADITALITLNTYTVDTVDWLVYDWGNVNTATTFDTSLTKDTPPVGDEYTWLEFTADCGRLELVVDRGASTSWWSELFVVNPDLVIDGQVPTNSSGCIYITAADPYKVSGIPYQNIPFTQRLWLPSDVGRPEYEFTNKGDPDADGSTSYTFRKAVKRHRFEVYVPEYLTDALASICIHGDVFVTDQYAATWQVYDPNLAVDWSSSPCLAITDFSFRRDLWRGENC